jgi:hypothetical protein
VIKSRRSWGDQETDRSMSDRDVCEDVHDGGVVWVCGGMANSDLEMADAKNREMRHG